MNIRRISSEDTDALARFFLTLTPAQRKDFHPHPFTTKMAERIAHGSAIAGPVWVATEREHIVGYVFLSGGIDDWPQLGIAVSPAETGRGLGTELVATAVEWARTNGKCGVVLTVYQDNVAAIRTYDKVGFRPTRALWFMEVDFSPTSYHTTLGGSGGGSPPRVKD